MPTPDTSFAFSEKPILDRVASPADLRALPDRDLPQLADELRREVIEVVSQTGGHLGSSLGVVELTVALHAVFDTPRDKVIWDVGHQCYPHKILTGRRHRMLTLRQADGLSGFTKRSESDYDPFGAAHSSTSISAALGFAMAREMGQAVGDTVAVIGDGAITAGMAYEAMNHAGHLGKRLFVILNDNDMSIAPPVGAMQTYLNSIANKGPLATLKAISDGLEDHLPGPLREGARRAREMVRDRPGGACALERALFPRAHSGQPPPRDRAAGFASHSWPHEVQRQWTKRLLWVPSVVRSKPEHTTLIASKTTAV